MRRAAHGKCKRIKRHAKAVHFKRPPFTG